MNSPEDMNSLSREDLLALVAQLQQQVAELTAIVEELRTENSQL
jgi:hypothetical protein